MTHVVMVRKANRVCAILVDGCLWTGDSVHVEAVSDDSGEESTTDVV